MEYIKRSQIHESRNWEQERAVSFLRIHKSDFGKVYQLTPKIGLDSSITNFFFQMEYMADHRHIRREMAG
jgi:hypothetical protein